ASPGPRGDPRTAGWIWRRWERDERTWRVEICVALRSMPRHRVLIRIPLLLIGHRRRWSASPNLGKATSLNGTAAPFISPACHVAGAKPKLSYSEFQQRLSALIRRGYEN